jgi:flagellar P-ring protein precursor FlgI
VTAAAITHGSLTVRVKESPKITALNKTTVDGTAVTTEPAGAIVEPDTDIAVAEAQARAFVFDPGTELSQVVDAINAVGATPSDLVAILEALKVSGALRAELIII